MLKLNNESKEEISRLIKYGYTSGILFDGKKQISWSLNIEMWE